MLVDNPEADIPIGLNRAIRAARYPTIVRVDAHSELEPGYTTRALATLDRVRAANVGGVMKADGRTPFQRAVARAYNSPIGLGGGAYHGGTQEGEAESAYLGVMRRDVLEEVGTVRREHPPRRGLGAQPAHPPGGLPCLVRSDAGGHLLAARELDPPGAAVLGDGQVAWRTRPPVRARQLGALLRAAGARPDARAQHRGRRAAAHGRADRVVGGRGIRRLSARDRVRPARDRRRARAAAAAPAGATSCGRSRCCRRCISRGARAFSSGCCAARTTRSTRPGWAAGTHRCPSPRRPVSDRGSARRPAPRRARRRAH